MNPKKIIMAHLNNPPCRHPAGATCAACNKIRLLLDGMSAGTATLVIKEAVHEKLEGEYAIEELANRGRYYTASIVNQEGAVIQKLLVDKQTGAVRFV